MEDQRKGIEGKGSIERRRAEMNEIRREKVFRGSLSLERDTISSEI